MSKKILIQENSFHHIYILNKIQNGIIDSNSVVSSYAREMKKVQIEDKENNNEEDNKNNGCQYC